MNEQELDEGVLAMYAMHMLDPGTELRVEAAAASDPKLRARIEEAQESLDALAIRQARTPPAGLKARILAAVEAEVHQEKQEGRFPLLHTGIQLTELVPLLDRPEWVRPDDAGDSHAIELERTADRETVLIWLDTFHPEEVHTGFVERILVLEGTCDIHLGNEVVALVPGELITIPLHVPHSVRVTSKTRCKAIVQRVAA